MIGNAMEQWFVHLPYSHKHHKVFHVSSHNPRQKKLTRVALRQDSTCQSVICWMDRWIDG